ncbi:MAG: ribose-phosphate pyrophosphokinase [Candidatus Bipolaricaulota bacterium]
MSELSLLSGRANRPLAEEAARLLGLEPCKATVGQFPDGEIRVHVQQTVRKKAVFIVQPTSPPVNDHFVELLLTVDALRRASAGMICAVIPYFGYARQDRKKRGRVPISARLVANLLETARVDRVLTVELHAGQIQGFFNVPVDHLRTDMVFTRHLNTCHPDWLENLAVVSPDLGGVWRARRLAKELHAEMAIVEKHRQDSDEESPEIMQVIGDVNGRDVLLVDDILSTGATLCEAAEALANAGARRLYAACTHGLFAEPALQLLEDSPLHKVLVTDTINHEVGLNHPKVEMVTVAPILADAIRRIHEGKSVSDLLVRS